MGWSYHGSRMSCPDGLGDALDQHRRERIVGLRQRLEGCLFLAHRAVGHFAKLLVDRPIVAFRPRDEGFDHRFGVHIA